jgi:hypothetical protein
MHQYASAGIQGFGRLTSCYAEGTPTYLTVIENLEASKANAIDKISFSKFLYFGFNFYFCG